MPPYACCRQYRQCTASAGIHACHCSEPGWEEQQPDCPQRPLAAGRHQTSPASFCPGASPHACSAATWHRYAAHTCLWLGYVLHHLTAACVFVQVVLGHVWPSSHTCNRDWQDTVLNLMSQLPCICACCLFVAATCWFLLPSSSCRLVVFLPASAEERDMANPPLLLCLLVCSKFKFPCVLPMMQQPALLSVSLQELPLGIL